MCISGVGFYIVFALFILHVFKLNWIIINYVNLYSLSAHKLFLIALEYKKHKQFFFFFFIVILIIINVTNFVVLRNILF
jgi:hypothetical protein